MVKLNSTDIWFTKELTSVAATATYCNPVSAGGYGFTLEEIILNGEPIVHSGSVSGAHTAGSTIIHLEPYHTFVVGDVASFDSIVGSYSVTAVSYDPANPYITITTPVPVAITSATTVTSIPNTVVAKIAIAKTQDKRKALQYGFNAAMVVKTIQLPNDASGNPLPASAASASPTSDIYRQLFIAYQAKDASGNELSNSVYQTANTWATNNLFNQTTWEWDMGTILYLSNKIPIYRKYAKSSTGYEEFKIML
jgi:hypothetical protein